MSGRILRVFPRKTKATPVDDLVRFDGPGWFEPDVDEVHVSVAFTYDMERSKRLADAWDARYPGKVLIGGPGAGMRGEDFVPGIYLKHGYVITSRGCPNACWFCSVPKRDGRTVRTIPITDGWILQDDNLLACPDQHVRDVFAMLGRQTEQAQLTGGLEAARLQDWHVELLHGLNPRQVFFAYDSPADHEPLIVAGRKLRSAGFTVSSKKLRAYVLCGYPDDTLTAAETRMRQAHAAGFWPMAMLYRDNSGITNPEWRRFQKAWARPASIYRLVQPDHVHE